MTIVSRAQFVQKPPAPGHLSPESRRVWRQIVNRYILEAHHLELLRILCESLDVGVAARERLAAEGLTIADANGVLHPHPCVAIARDARLAAVRILKALDLDYEAPGQIGRPAG